MSVLKQFLADAEKLTQEISLSLDEINEAGTGCDEQRRLIQLYRPIHSLKGISSMIEEGKPLMNAFHLLESALPPLVLTRKEKSYGVEQVNGDWKEKVQQTLQWSKGYYLSLRRQLELWKTLGAEQNESYGLVVRPFFQKWVFIPITSIRSLTEEEGAQLNASSNLRFELDGVEHSLLVDELAEVCSRLDSKMKYQALSLKEWISDQEVDRAA